MFVGREAELAAVRAELCLAATGPARRVMIEGPEGIGKTALIRHALAGASGTRTISTSGDAGERHLRYGVARRLLPDLAADDPWTAGQALCEAIRCAQAAGPVVVVVDDAQWADRPSLRALCYAVRRLGGERVLVLAACRDADDPWLPTGLRRLLTGDGACRISLQGLSVAELARLPVREPEGAIGSAGQPRGSSGHPDEAAVPRRRLRGGEGSAEPPPEGVRALAAPGEPAPSPLDGERTTPGEALSEPAAARLRAHTLGNPLHARAMLAALPVSALADPGVRLPAPVTYARTFTRRLRSCGPSARALIGACAVLGEDCTLYEAATVARAMPEPRAGGPEGDRPGRDGPEGDGPEGDGPGVSPELDALEEAVAAGVLVEEPGRVIRFREPLGRAAAYDALGAGTRARLH
ncbi:AAA family ATPase, partial [Nonomuraea sp. MCN248]